MVDVILYFICQDYHVLYLLLHFLFLLFLFSIFIKNIKSVMTIFIINSFCLFFFLQKLLLFLIIVLSHFSHRIRVPRIRNFSGLSISTNWRGSIIISIRKKKLSIVFLFVFFFALIMSIYEDRCTEENDRAFRKFPSLEWIFLRIVWKTCSTVLMRIDSTCYLLWSRHHCWCCTGRVVC